MKKLISLAVAATLFATSLSAAVIIPPRPIIIPRPVIVPRTYVVPRPPVYVPRVVPAPKPNPYRYSAPTPLWIWVPIFPGSHTYYKCDPRTSKRKCR